MVANLADIKTNKLNIIEKPLLSLVKNESSNSPTNNISELLAGNIEKENNISDIKDKDLQKAKDKNNSGILSHLLGFGLGILLGIPLTMLLVKTNSFGHFFNFFSKTKCAKNLQKALRPQFIKRELRARKAQLANFKYIKFRKCTNMKKAKRLAQRLGITIQAEQKDIAQLNDTLSVFTDLYNQSKGRISMPKKLAIVKDLKNYSADANRLFTIRLTSCSDRGDLLHELGHINHFKKLGFDKDLILEIKQFKDFGIDKDTLSYISEILGDYATTAPHEFVAECYKELLLGKKLPDRIMKIYKMFNGPTNWKYVKKPIVNYNVNFTKIVTAMQSLKSDKHFVCRLSDFKN